MRWMISPLALLTQGKGGMQLDVERFKESQEEKVNLPLSGNTLLENTKQLKPLLLPFAEERFNLFSPLSSFKRDKS